MSTSQLVVFKLDNEEYGIDIMDVLEIIRYQQVRPVPQVPDYIEGVINLREEIYPIFNLRKRFSMEKEEIDDDTKIILTSLGDIKVGFIVDSVCEILSIENENIKKTPTMLMKYDNRYIKGISEQKDRIVILLNIDLIISDDEKEELETIIT
ncbi:MAG: chemotaxis protein CheW [Cellulosilyticaceae bacterium]